MSQEASDNMFPWEDPVRLRDFLRQQSLSTCTKELIPGFLKVLRTYSRQIPHPSQYPFFLDAILLSHATLSSGVNHPHTSKNQFSCEEFFQEFKPKSSNQALCGYLFQKNDIAFNCKTCQLDETCVLCMKCYQNSNHEGHDIYFHRTMPGGMCDCGDPEAWAPEGFCVNHRGSSSNNSSSSSHHHHSISTGSMNQEETLLPEAVIQIARALFREITSFFVEIAKRSIDVFHDEKVAQQAQERLVSLQKPPEEPMFHVRISNDDVHSDEELVQSLHKKNIADAKRLVKAIDSNGSELVLCHVSLREALALMKDLMNESWHVSIVDDQHIVDEDLLVVLIKWVKRICALNTKMHTIFCEELFSQSNPTCAPKEPIGIMFLSDPYFRKEIVMELYGLYLKLQGEKDLKVRFSLVFMKVYSRLMAKYFCGVGTHQESLFQYGVQIFTTPSVVKQLTCLGLLEMLFDTLNIALDVTKISANCETYAALISSHGDQARFDIEATDDFGLSTIDFLGPQNAPYVLQTRKTKMDLLDPNHSLVKFKRYLFVVDNLGYILNIPFLASEIMTRKEILTKWLATLRQMQGLDPQLRVQHTQHHVSYETQTWVSAFTLHVNISKLSLALVKGLRKEKNQHQLIIQQQQQTQGLDTIETSTSRTHQVDYEKMVLNFMELFWEHLQIYIHSNCMKLKWHLPRFGHLFFNQGNQSHQSLCQIIQYDVATQPVSFHYPLHQLFASFLQEMMYYYDPEQQQEKQQQRLDWPRFFQQTTATSSTPKDQVRKELIHSIIELPLRTLVFSSQIQAGLWLRNGTNMNRQMAHYLIPPWCSELRDLDLLLIQFGGLCVGFSQFLNIFFDRCGLMEWLMLPSSSSSSSSLTTKTKTTMTTPSSFYIPPHVSEGKMIPLLEESLLKMIWLVTELPFSHQALYEQDAVLRREIVHRLAQHPCRRSELLEQTSFIMQTPAGAKPTRYGKDHVSRLEAVLDQVANVMTRRNTGSCANKTPSGPDTSANATSVFGTAASANMEVVDHGGVEDDSMETGLEPNKYELKRDCFVMEYDPAFYHLSRSQHEKAQIGRQETVLRFWKVDDPPIPMIGRLLDVHESFSTFRLVLLENGLFCILRLLLEDATLMEPKKTSVMVVMHVLHLLNLSVLLLKDKNTTLDETKRQHVLEALKSGRETFEESELWRHKKRLKQDQDGDTQMACAMNSSNAGSDSDQSSTIPQEVKEQSIIALLVSLVKYQLKHDFATLKTSISTIYWILSELSKMDLQIDFYLKKKLWDNNDQKKGLYNVNKDQLSKTQLRKLHQQKAIEAMMARQKAFAQSHMADFDMEDDEENEEEVGGEHMVVDDEHDDDIVVKAGPPPDCIICSQIEDEPIMYIGHAQTSQVNAHALYGKACSQDHTTACKTPQMYLQLCGHAVHLECWRKYFHSMRKQAEANGQGVDNSQNNPAHIAFDTQLGEFLCPLCQTLSSMLVPYVALMSSHPKYCTRKARHFEKEAMEHVFQNKQHVPSLLKWITQDLPHKLQFEMKDALLPPRTEAQHRAVVQFSTTFLEAMTRFRGDQDLGTVFKTTRTQLAHIIWSSVSSTCFSAQLSGISSAVCSLELASNAATMPLSLTRQTSGPISTAPCPPLPPLRSPAPGSNNSSISSSSSSWTAGGSPLTPRTTGSSGFSSLRITSILNPPLPPLRSRLAVSLPESLEQQLDPFSPKDDSKMNCIFRALSQLPLLYHDNEDFRTAVCVPLALSLKNELTLDKWLEAVRVGAPLSFGQPLFVQDLFYTLLSICSLLHSKADILMTIRSFCVLHTAQIVLQCSALNEEEEDEGPPNFHVYTDHEIQMQQALEQMMQRLTSACGLTSNNPRPSGGQLMYLFQSCALVFLRQATLLCRAFFRGENDPDTAHYANFVSSLRLTTNYTGMCRQLGVPTIDQIVLDEPLMNYLAKAASQMASCAHSCVEEQVKIDYFKGEPNKMVDTLLQLASNSSTTTSTLSSSSIFERNLSLCPPLPIRMVEESDDEEEEDTDTDGNGTDSSTVAAAVVVEDRRRLRRTTNVMPPRMYFANVKVINLPNLYTDLYVKYVGRKCKTTGKVQENPAICLICEEVVCGGSECCRRQNVGACTQHALTCGDGVGMFFLMRNCSILLIFGPRSSYFASPYVDMFGEEDYNLRRGRPLYLNSKRVKAVLNLYSSHQIANEVARNRRSSDHYIRNNYY